MMARQVMSDGRARACGSRCSCTVIRQQGSLPIVPDRWPLLAVGLGAALVLAEGEFARALLDARAIHALDPPAARQHDDPLRRGVLVPVADPADRLHGEDDGRLAALHLVVPLRVGGADALQLVVGRARTASDG